MNEPMYMKIYRQTPLDSDSPPEEGKKFYNSLTELVEEYGLESDEHYYLLVPSKLSDCENQETMLNPIQLDPEKFRCIVEAEIDRIALEKRKPVLA